MRKPQMAQLNQINSVNLSLAFTYIFWEQIQYLNYFFLMGFMDTINKLFSICAEPANQNIFFKSAWKHSRCFTMVMWIMCFMAHISSADTANSYGDNYN